MRKTMINIIPFNGNPFSKPIFIWKYTMNDHFNWSEIGKVAREIRKSTKGNEVLIFQNGRSLFCNKDLGKFERLKDVYVNKINSTEKVKLNVKNDSDRELIRRLLGEAFAYKLRNLQQRHAYKVTERTFFYESLTPYRTSFDEIEVWYGFIYVPIIRDDGFAGIIIDPKGKYHTKKTLREIIDLERDIDRLKLLDETHIDICPDPDCPDKSDPFSICVLSESGRSIRISEFIEKSPSEYSIKKDGITYDLISFQNRDGICHRNILSNFIKDIKPIAKTNFDYTYPLERLRRSPKPHLLTDQNDRRILHQITTLNPKQRYKKTQEYSEILNDLFINESLTLTSNSELLTPDINGSGKLRSGYFSPSKLIMGTDVSYYPLRDINQYGPYNKPNDGESSDGFVIYFGEHNEIKDFSDILKNVIFSKNDSFVFDKYSIDEDFSNRISFNNLLNMKINIMKEFVVKRNDDIENVLREICDHYKTNRNTICLLCYGNNLRELHISSLKNKLLVNDIPNQGINITKFMENLISKRSRYFQNIVLGAFCKLGGVPWSINYSKDDIYFIGYSKIIRDEVVSYTLTLYDSKGIWKHGIFNKTEISQFSNGFKDDLKTIFSTVPSNSNIRFYVNGALYDNLEYKMISGALDEVSSKNSILEIINNPIRIYNISNTGWYSANRGSYVEVIKNQFGLVTTIPPGKQGTPNPIYVRLRKGKQEFVNDYLKELFLLTHSYGGYVGLNTRYPSPIHAARSIIQKIAGLNIDKVYFESPWFI